VEEMQSAGEVSTYNGCKKKVVIKTVEMHTGGEPLRVVVAGET